MNNANDKNYWCCIIDLDNNQKSYSKYLRLILSLEELSNLHQDNSSMANSLSISFQKFHISRIQGKSIQNIEQILYQETLLKEGDNRQCAHILSPHKFLSGLMKSSKINEFSYYLRVHCNKNESDLTDLQYLVLLLQTLPKIRTRIAVRLMEHIEGNWKTSDYFRISHYMRFIQKEYQCFYACYNEKIGSLELLTQEVSGVQTTFLPLLQVNAKLCQVLNKTGHLSANYINQAYDKLYTAFVLKEYEQEKLAYDLFQIGLRMLLKNIPGRNYRTKKAKIELLQFFCNLFEEVQGITPLDMLLFGTLISDELKEGLNHDVAKTCMGNAQTLSLALGQILENIVNHSERNQGVFTFRIQSNKAYLNVHYPNYAIAENKKCLEVLVADSNQQEGIVEHFLSSNKADSEIKSLGNKVELSQLFGRYKNSQMQEIWQNAREKRPEMCHGLLSFSESVQKLDGAIWVRSTNTFESRTYKDIYYHNGTTEYDSCESFIDTMYIPGTQFSIAINLPIVSTMPYLGVEHEEWAFDFNKLVYATSYRELAQVLTFDENVIVLDLHENLSQSKFFPKNQEEKDIAAKNWQKWFNNQINFNDNKSRKVYLCDLDELGHILIQSPECGEPFCKGLLSSKFFITPNKNKFSCILMQNPSAFFSRIFAATVNAIRNLKKFTISNTCVYFYPKQYSGDYLPYCAATLHDLLHTSIDETVFPKVFPYTLFVKGKDNNTLFESELLNQANTFITDRDHQGFKIADTHMRLGNKVHIDTFYEMALFFENPNCAYYTSFLFLREFLKRDLDFNKKILFYSYASYSRAIIWAIIKILEQYYILVNQEKKLDADKEDERLKEIKKKFTNNVAFAIYQNDLKLQSDQPQTQMYYNQEEWQRNPKNIWNPKDTMLVMIVPISSSLTTFNKMLAELNRETNKVFFATENFTAFWVRNHYKDESKPTNEEEPFWQQVDVQNKIIESDLVQGKIRYMVSVKSKWSNPLKCSMCFPIDPIMEFPLVETDPTSTVPTQQFYCDQDIKKHEFKSREEELENDERVCRLRGKIYYGHISKGGNHYQYYIKTKLYFQQERDEIEIWLRKLRQRAAKEKNPCVVNPSCINVLVIPQEADNVEFGQYVYEYFFEGCAECIIINTEKEYRSNLLAEYSGLFSRLCAVKNPAQNIRFHFVDISIRTGNSYNRAVSLISSCMNAFNKLNDRNDEIQSYEFYFDQIFLLVNRMSDASKRIYVHNAEYNFHAYVEVHISAMRTFGDSCVPCKIQREAQRYYKKAATKSISSYWEEKTYTRACIPFDKFEESIQFNMDSQEEGYRRMVCSHRAAYYMNPVHGASVADYFYAIRSFLGEISNANKNDKYEISFYKNINDFNRKDWLSAGLKIIVRPFFSYDYRTRCAVMDLFLILAEIFIKRCSIEEMHIRLQNEDKDKKKRYLIVDNNLEWIYNFAEELKEAIGDDLFEQLSYIRDHILKGLVDMKSNYILRKKTILCLSDRVGEMCSENNEIEKVKDFYQHYLRSILRLTRSSSDETKGVWLEFMLQYGEEYQENVQGLIKGNGLEELIAAVCEKVSNEFRNFLEVLLVENNRPIYQAVIEYDKKIREVSGTKDFLQCDKMQMFLNEYHMRNAYNFLSFSQYTGDIVQQLNALRALLVHLKKNSKMHTNDGDVIDRYLHLGERIQYIFDSETTLGKTIILFGKRTQKLTNSAEEYLNLPDYFVLYPANFDGINQGKENVLQESFENNWKQIQNDDICTTALNNNGFFLFRDNEKDEKHGVVIQLDNNYDYLQEKLQNERFHQDTTITKIDSIYIYIPCILHRKQILELTRKILMFRRKLVEWLENDFNNNAIAVLSKQQQLAKLLSTDKMGDHADNDFVDCQQNLLQAVDQNMFDEELNHDTWNYGTSEDGKRIEKYKLGYETKPPIEGQLSEPREWFLLRSYVNARISRLFRTMARTADTLKQDYIIDPEVYYAQSSQSAPRHLVQDLQTLFFTPVYIGYMRKNYLRFMMHTVYFTVEGVPDYLNLKKKEGDIKPEQYVEARLSNLHNLLQDFSCIQLVKNSQRYGYLSEYLATILLDCFVSGVKAGKIWNTDEWGGEAYHNLYESKVQDKCRIDLSRKKGGECNGVAYDYLVIHNKIHSPLRSDKKGPGMSLAAIRWYVEGLWRTSTIGINDYPKVNTKKTETDYEIELPILKRRIKNEKNGLCD